MSALLCPGCNEDVNDGRDRQFCDECGAWWHDICHDGTDYDSPAGPRVYHMTGRPS